MSKEVSVYFDPTVNFNLKCFDEIPEVDLDPSFLYWSLDFGYLGLD